MSHSLAPMEKGVAYALTKEVPEYRWANYQLTVVRDGYDMDGTRIHFVKEPGYDDAHIANAHVFSDGGYDETH